MRRLRHAGKLQSLVVISGMSGSGKHTVFQALEDLGYLCVDNIPTLLVPQLVQVTTASGSRVTRMAIVIDVRFGHSISSFRELYVELQRAPFESTVLFIDASDDVLVRRFSETRRAHPLAHDRTLLEGIQAERQELSEIRALANRVVDTSDFSVHDLKRFIYDRFQQERAEDRLQVALVSFGFKYGLPDNADLVFDVRFLPNPFFISDLRPLTGEDPLVVEYLMKLPESQEFVSRLSDLLLYLLPRYEEEGKKYLTVAIGCTGGRHRSVTISGCVRDRLRAESYACHLVHRDMPKES